MSSMLQNLYSDSSSESVEACSKLMVFTESLRPLSGPSVISTGTRAAAAEVLWGLAGSELHKAETLIRHWHRPRVGWGLRREGPPLGKHASLLSVERWLAHEAEYPHPGSRAHAWALPAA